MPQSLVCTLPLAMVSVSKVTFPAVMLKTRVA